MPNNILVPLIVGVFVLLVAFSGIRFIPNNRIAHLCFVCKCKKFLPWVSQKFTC